MPFNFNLETQVQNPRVVTTAQTGYSIQTPTVRPPSIQAGQGFQMPAPGAFTQGTTVQRGGVGVAGAHAPTAPTGDVNLDTKTWSERFAADRQARNQRAIDKKHEDLNYEWTTHYEPKQKEFAQQMEQQAMDEANRALAEMQARYGYMRSAGAGTAGMWESGQLNMESKMMAVRSAIVTTSENYLRDMYNAWMNKKDEQHFQEEMVRLQAYYREEYAEKVAELNGPSWWSVLGGVVGQALGLIPGVGGYVSTKLGLAKYADVGKGKKVE